MPQGFGTNWSTKNESRQNHLTTLVDKKFDTIRLTKKLDKDVFEKVWFRYLSEIRRKCSTKMFDKHSVGRTNPYFLFDSFVFRSVEDPWMTFFHSFLCTKMRILLNFGGSITEPSVTGFRILVEPKRK